MCGGEEKTFNSVLKVLQVYSKACNYMGPAGFGQATKISN